jgi:hypothetical protein
MSITRFPPYIERFTFFDKLLANHSDLSWSSFSFSSLTSTNIVAPSTVDRFVGIIIEGYTFAFTSVNGFVPSVLVSYTSGASRFSTLFGSANPLTKINNMAVAESRFQGYYSLEDSVSKSMKNFFIVPLPANLGLDFRLSSIVQTPTLSISVTAIQARKPFLFLVSGEVSTANQPITIATGNYSALVDLAEYPILNWSSIISFNTEANITKSTQLNITGGVTSSSWNSIVRTSGTQTGVVNLYNTESIFHNQRGVRTLEITRPIINGVQLYSDVILAFHPDEYAL